MKKRNLIIIGIVAFVAIAMILKLSSNKKVIEKNAEVIDRTHIPVAVNVVKVESRKLAGVIMRPAVVDPNDKATIAPSASGKILSLNYELGTHVSKGQVIGSIDTKTLQTQLKNLELNIAKLKRDYERNQDLYKGNALSESNLLDSKFALESREIEAQQVRQQISDGNIISPLSGMITDKKYLAGEFISIGTPLATVVDVDAYKVFVFLNENEVKNVSKGQVVNITSRNMPGKTFTGKINYVAPTADDNYNYKIEIRISAKENKELIAGTYVNVEFKVAQDSYALQIPKKALTEGVKKAYVYVKEGDKAVRKDIVVGREVGEYIEVVSGLKEGDLVVVDGQINIVNGSFIATKDNK